MECTFRLDELFRIDAEDFDDGVATMNFSDMGCTNRVKGTAPACRTGMAAEKKPHSYYCIVREVAPSAAAATWCS